MFVALHIMILSFGFLLQTPFIGDTLEVPGVVKWLLTPVYDLEGYLIGLETGALTPPASA